MKVTTLGIDSAKSIFRVPYRRTGDETRTLLTAVLARAEIVGRVVGDNARWNGNGTAFLADSPAVLTGAVLGDGVRVGEGRGSSKKAVDKQTAALNARAVVSDSTPVERE